MHFTQNIRPSTGIITSNDRIDINDVKTELSKKQILLFVV